ncbi:MAG: hypothetical protein CFE21_16220 [Bacteroidetes bacterium B1(2017)]|nr:MAG: hypothetical protein CFE21_16220 [Bacteroidetes bacterium B1(2017)]
MVRRFMKEFKSSAAAMRDWFPLHLKRDHAIIPLGARKEEREGERARVSFPFCFSFCFFPLPKHNFTNFKRQSYFFIQYLPFVKQFF